MNDVTAGLAGFGFRHIWAIDFEFVARPGHRPTVVCMVAKCLLTCTVIRLWGGELARCPFTCSDDELFVAYYASAEASCFDALGWPRPRRMLDLFAEFRRLTNGGGNAHGNGLIGALLHFGLPNIGGEEKVAMRDLIMRGGPWTDIERQQILDYCESDVVALLRLLPSLLRAANYTDADFGRALLRGRYMVAAGAVENNGIPIDAYLLSRLARHWSGIKNQLIRAIDADYGVYDGSHPKERQACKAIVLGTGYGMSAEGMAQQAGLHVEEARKLLRLHHETYRRFWGWAEDNVNRVLLGMPLETTFGWRIQYPPGCGKDVNPRSILNWPMQANGAEMMRLGLSMGIEAGLKVCAPIHDALLLEAPIDEIDAQSVKLAEIMGDASELVLGPGKRCRSDIKIVRYPDRYEDERGVVMFQKVMALLEAIEGGT